MSGKKTTLWYIDVWCDWEWLKKLYWTKIHDVSWLCCFGLCIDIYICISSSYMRTFLFVFIPRHCYDKCHVFENNDKPKKMHHFERLVGRTMIDIIIQWLYHMLRCMHGLISSSWVIEWGTTGVYHWNKHASLPKTLHHIALHFIFYSHWLWLLSLLWLWICEIRECLTICVKM